MLHTITLNQLESLIASIVYSTTSALIFFYVFVSVLTPFVVYFLKKRLKI